MTMTRQEVKERFNSIPPRRINDMQFHALKHRIILYGRLSYTNALKSYPHSCKS